MNPNLNINYFLFAAVVVDSCQKKRTHDLFVFILRF